MKNIKLIILAISTLLFLSSCGGDDDPVTTSYSESDIVGTWNLIDMNGTTESTTTISGISIVGTTEITTLSSDATVTFTTSPNEFAGDGSVNLRSVTTSNGGDFTTEQETNPFESGEWSIANTTLTSTFNGETTQTTILELTNTRLKLKTTIDETSTDSGITTRITGELYQTFER